MKPSITIPSPSYISQYIKVSYSNNTKVGTATVTLKANSEGYGGMIQKTFDIVPKTPAIRSLTVGSNRMTVKMAAKVSATGGQSYQIQYKQKGSSSWKSTSTTSQSKTIKSLKKGKQYYVRVRAYKKVGSKTYYGAFSNQKLSKKIK